MAGITVWYYGTARGSAVVVFTVLLSRPTLLNSLLPSLYVYISFTLQTVLVQRRPYWRSDLEGIKNLPSRGLEVLFSPLSLSLSLSVLCVFYGLLLSPLLWSDFPLFQSVTSSSSFPLLIAYILSLFRLSLSVSFLHLRKSFLSSFMSIYFSFFLFFCLSPLSQSVLGIILVSHNLILWACLGLSSTAVLYLSLTALSLQLESYGRYFPSCTFW